MWTFWCMIQVLADVISFLTEKNDIITLEICTCLLPLLVGLLESNVHRYKFELNEKIYLCNLIFILAFGGHSLGIKTLHWICCSNLLKYLVQWFILQCLRQHQCGLILRQSKGTISYFLIFPFFGMSNLNALFLVRMERYNLCFVELEKVKNWLPALTRCVSASSQVLVQILHNWIHSLYFFSSFFHSGGEGPLPNLLRSWV